MSEAFISLKELKVGFQDTAICQIESLDLKRHCITVLCGPNGVGKSTLLKTIAKQIQPISGNVFIEGKSTSELTATEIAKKLAFVPQFIETRRSLTVEEWVALGRNPHQKWWSWETSDTDKKKIDEALERTMCSSLKSKVMDELSGGERQRVLIATALAQEPSYMLLDEPTAHLDFRFQLELLDLLKQLKSENLGILIVLHDLNLAARIADEVILLRKSIDELSTVACFGSVTDVLSPQSLRDVYGVEMEILKTDDGAMQAYIATSITK